jgi:phospholipid/cholesterol/gamma-HCH transport system substrate-binding protein
MSNRQLRIRLGLFVVVAMGLLATLIVIFGSMPTLFRRSTIYTIRFTDAPGLAAGAPVRRSGVRIGEVISIELDEERGVVRAKVGLTAPYQIRRSDVPTLVTGVLGVDAAIDLLPREPEEGEVVDRTPWEVGSELVGTRAVTVGQLVKGASDVVPSAQETLNEIRKSMARVERLATRVEKSVPIFEDTLRDYQKLAQRANQTIPELEKTNAQVQQLLRSGQDAMPDVQRGIEELQLLLRDARAAWPDLLRTNKEVQELARGVREALPTVQTTFEEVQNLAADSRKVIPKVESGIEDAATATRQVNRFVEDINTLYQSNKERIDQTIKDVANIASQTSRLLSDQNRQSVERTLRNLEQGSNRIPKITEDLSDASAQGRTTLRQLAQAAEQVQSTLNDVQRVTRPLGERSERIVANVDSATAQINLLLGDVRAFLRAVDQSTGTLRKFLNDPSLYNNLDGTVVGVLKLLPQIERILKDVEVFADKLARHPEALGIGGVIRPGSGLKNPPTPPIQPSPLYVPHP